MKTLINRYSFSKEEVSEMRRCLFSVMNCDAKMNLLTAELFNAISDAWLELSLKSE